MLHEFRYSVRILRRSPGIAVMTVCTFALAIGASTAVFTVIDPVLLRRFRLPSRIGSW